MTVSTAPPEAADIAGLHGRIRKRFADQRYAGQGAVPASNEIRIRIALNLIGSGHRVLDVGCYDGSIMARIEARGSEVVGIDLSAPALEIARARGLRVVEGDLEKSLPFPDGAFSVVFAGEVLEHVYHVDGFVAEIRRVLEPHGALVLTTPNLASLGRRGLLLVGKDPYTNVSPFEGAGHLRYFVRETLEAFLARRGFAIETLCSDVVHLTPSGRVRSRLLARAFPRLGRSLIVKARRLPD